VAVLVDPLRFLLSGNGEKESESEVGFALSWPLFADGVADPIWLTPINPMVCENMRFLEYLQFMKPSLPEQSPRARFWLQLIKISGVSTLAVPVPVVNGGGMLLGKSESDLFSP
jgi:hypothetical protein